MEAKSIGQHKDDISFVVESKLFDSLESWGTRLDGQFKKGAKVGFHGVYMGL